MIEALLERIERLEAILRERGEVPHTNVAARVTMNVAQPVANGTPVPVTAWDTVQFDPFSMFDIAQPSRLTVPVAGTYIVIANLRYAINPTGYRQTIIQVNNTLTIGGELRNTVSAGDTFFPVTAQYTLNAGDYVTVIAQQGSGAVLNILPANAYVGFSVARIA